MTVNKVVGRAMLRFVTGWIGWWLAFRRTAERVDATRIDGALVYRLSTVVDIVSTCANGSTTPDPFVMS
ncbi:hypothetical protein ACOSQ3_009682 [Xanthoceras sorbifolium]